MITSIDLIDVFLICYSKMLKSIKSFEYINPESKRSKDLSCRIWTDGYSKGIAYHRKQTSKILVIIYLQISLAEMIIFRNS